MNKKTWITEGFDAFRRGTFENGGQNLYVSKKGVLQRIFQYDLDRNGYIDLVFANCQDHHESAPTYVYTIDGKQKDILPGQGSYCGMAADLNGDGYQDIVVSGYYDMAAPFASTDIYFGSEEGYSEKYHIRIPTPYTEDCCSGDFNGTGKPILAFAMPVYRAVRLFEQTELDTYEWDAFTDLDAGFPVKLIAAADLDGDGYDDLILRGETTETVVLWGSADGLDPANRTVLPAFPDEEILFAEKSAVEKSEMEAGGAVVRLLQTVRWNGHTCFTLSTGRKLLFYAANEDRSLTCVLELSVPLALSAAVGDIDGDGYDDIVITSEARDPANPEERPAYIIWNGPEGLDKRERTPLSAEFACHASILDNRILLCQCMNGTSFTADSLLYTYPDLTTPQRFTGEDARRGYLFCNPDGVVRIALINHMARSAIGFDEAYIYWGGKDGYSPNRMTPVPGHCAVDALIADLDDDGWAELVIGNNSENSLHLDVGHHIHYFGPNGFEPERTRTIEANCGWGVVAGDFNHDGYLEMITSANVWSTLRIFYGKDDFKTFDDIALPKGSEARWPLAVDLNNDGWLDLVVPDAKEARIFWGGPDGFSLERSQRLATRLAIAAAAADLTKNGYPDLIVGGHTDTLDTTLSKGELAPHQPHHSFVYIYWNGPDGISESRKCVLRGDAADSFAIADFNGDGWLDIFSGSYHGGKDRDINSFLYWNREGKFRELDRDLLFTHSASGCMAADFNEDGYIDLAIANHKVDGDHHGYSSVWWNSAAGFNSANRTDLPTNGPHGMISTDIGNIADRTFSEYYISEPYIVDEDCVVTDASVEGEIPPKTAVNIHLSVNGGEWQAADGVVLRQGDSLRYRLELYAYNCLRTPRITKVTVAFASRT